MKVYKHINHFIINIICNSLMMFSLFYGSPQSYASVPFKNTGVIEIIYPANINGEEDRLLSFCKQQQFIDANDIYKWGNHFVIYGSGYARFQSKIKSTFKECTIKFYDKPFYDFDRSRCTNKKVSTQLDNILLTANLVADPKMQQEYLSYHATQFEQWPEVSQGFCNAQFQRLLVFKNGRQLMLIISIPKGESLDKLNPLTTKDNPRVNEWNKIMAKYQEGIAGTKKGETWVFLKPYRQINHINNN